MQEDDYLEWATHIRECLDSTFVGVLATAEKGGAWATPIYFIYDEEFNIYFMSDSKTRHIIDIEKAANVSVAVFMPAADSHGFKVGIQIEGVATKVPDQDIEEVYMRRSMRLTGSKTWNRWSNGGHLISSSGGVFIKITPKSMNYTDRRFFGGESKKISMKKLIEASKYVKY